MTVTMSAWEEDRGHREPLGGSRRQVSVAVCTEVGSPAAGLTTQLKVQCCLLCSKYAVQAGSALSPSQPSPAHRASPKAAHHLRAQSTLPDPLPLGLYHERICLFRRALKGAGE